MAAFRCPRRCLQACRTTTGNQYTAGFACFGLLTPPFGIAVFVIKSTLDDDSISLGDIFRGAAPFALMMLFVLGLVMIFPQLAILLL